METGKNFECIFLRKRESSLCRVFRVSFVRIGIEGTVLSCCWIDKGARVGFSGHERVFKSRQRIDLGACDVLSGVFARLEWNYRSVRIGGV
jgi:hypothetical protein